MMMSAKTEQEIERIKYEAKLKKAERVQVYAKVRMMPGQTPYTEAELETVYQLVSDAADDDPGEVNE